MPRLAMRRVRSGLYHAQGDNFRIRRQPNPSSAGRPLWYVEKWSPYTHWYALCRRPSYHAARAALLGILLKEGLL